MLCSIYYIMFEIQLCRRMAILRVYRLERSLKREKYEGKVRELSKQDSVRCKRDGNYTWNWVAFNR